eukprot:gb/GECH01000637.1/.p1 GENE.gb/GECH01000637.1/~~gb/GECH01000637.1/.p1  ORF type:complete len:383 (+),score=84.52 gb/GECH01000637.1/:1-1149(+)
MFLNSPVTKALKGHDKNQTLEYGFCSMQGYRSTMEDRHTTLLSTDEDLDDQGQQLHSFFAIYDGHAGDEAAAYCEKHMKKNILKQSSLASNCPKAIVDGFKTTDAQFRKKAEKEELYAGSTAVVVLVDNGSVYVGHCGDSKCILAQRDKTLTLTMDHKPSNSKEQRRITKAGGFVLADRVLGQLAVSRAMGDYFPFKSVQGIPPEEQMVVSVPDIRIHTRNDRDRFILIACDGLWDVMTPKEAVNTVRDLMRSCSNLAMVCQRLVEKAILQLGSHDNVSVILVRFLKENTTESKPSKESSSPSNTSRIPFSLGRKKQSPERRRSPSRNDSSSNSKSDPTSNSNAKRKPARSLSPTKERLRRGIAMFSLSKNGRQSNSGSKGS